MNGTRIKRQHATWFPKNTENTLILIFVFLFIAVNIFTSNLYTKCLGINGSPSSLSPPSPSSSSRSLKSPHFKIIHVISPYKNNTCEPSFCPFNQEQSVAIASMQRARLSTKHDVALAAATLSGDVDIIPADFIALKPLRRTTASEYPTLVPRRELPYAQDIFDAVVESGLSYDYVIYTNADIIVRDDFYNQVWKVANEGYDVFTINRQTIKKSYTKNGKEKLYTPLDLDEIYELEGDEHPGHDCFVIKRENFEEIDMGNIFIGAPPFGQVMMLQLEDKAKKPMHFVSDALKVTFHLGDEQSWKKTTMRNVWWYNYRNAICGGLTWMEICPRYLELNRIDYIKQQCKRMRRNIPFFVGGEFKFEYYENWCKNNTEVAPRERSVIWSDAWTG